MPPYCVIILFQHFLPLSFGRDKYCVLIVISPKWLNATYFDSGSTEKPKDYTNIKRVLNHALVGYKMMVVTVKREKKH
jgi:hypothetical protein